MKHRTKFLIVGTILPLVLLFWPFAQWNNAMSFLLRVVPAFSLQLLLCRYRLFKILPLLATGAAALWGIWLFHTSSAWMHATLGGLIADYISPFLACIMAYGLSSLKKSKGV